MNINENKIMALSREIRGTGKMIKELSEVNDPLSKPMIMQYQHMQQQLLKDLLVAIIKSEISFKNAGELIGKLTDYLKKLAEEEKLTEELKSNLKEVEKTVMAVSS
ncbi:MAG TPA: hypothetical protein ENJ95_18515 [Bacteroidetes bacterium]|nr:hypothetical protein [Bacteroidota bacterium]